MKTEILGSFGSHLMLECYGCSREKLSDSGFVFNFLDVFPERIGLTKVMPPNVFKYQGKNSEEWGISGAVRIAESHISIHTFPDKEHAFIDIFSCKEFDAEHARREALSLIEARHHETVLTCVS